MRLVLGETSFTLADQSFTLGEMGFTLANPSFTLSDPSLAPSSSQMRDAVQRGTEALGSLHGAGIWGGPGGAQRAVRSVNRAAGS